jgi:hypothetical protein
MARKLSVPTARCFDFRQREPRAGRITAKGPARERLWPAASIAPAARHCGNINKRGYGDHRDVKHWIEHKRQHVVALSYVASDVNYWISGRVALTEINR